MAKSGKKNAKRQGTRGRRKGPTVSERMPELDRRRINASPSPDSIDALWPDLDDKTRHTLLALAARSEEIEHWFLADPERLRSLATDPEKAFKALIKDFRLEGFTHKAGDAPEVVLEVKVPSAPPFGSALVDAVWEDVARRPDGFQGFRADTDKQVHKSADRTGATDAEREAVLESFRRILKLAGKKRDASVLASHRARLFRRPVSGPRVSLRLKRGEA